MPAKARIPVCNCGSGNHPEQVDYFGYAGVVCPECAAEKLGYELYLLYKRDRGDWVNGTDDDER